MEASNLQPESVPELARALAEAAAARHSITLGGVFSKRGMAGPVAASDVTISTARLCRVLKYEPRDLTISVEAGIRYRELSRVLAEQRQMIPLDPPFADEATIGGVLAANMSGPRRRLYGTARDMVIGMTFATLEGKLVQTGGMVVKNVAGLDMAKLLIGSFGTLAAIATVNFKVHPMPAATLTFAWEFDTVQPAIVQRDVILRSVLQPAAIDLWKTGKGYTLLVQAGGSQAVLERYSRELTGSQVYQGEEEKTLWHLVRELVPVFLRKNPNGVAVRISTELTEVGAVLESLPAPAVARAGSGVIYACFAKAEEAAGKGVVEFAPPAFREKSELWPAPGDDLGMMKKVKQMLDPEQLLNRGRLYGRI